MLCCFTTPDGLGYIDIEKYNGFNLYSYCDNDPINYYDPDGNEGIKVFYRNKKTDIFGYEQRVSAGWDTTPSISTNYFGRCGISSYITHASGESGTIYMFFGKTIDELNWFQSIYYLGTGINLFNTIKIETQGETFGMAMRIGVKEKFIVLDLNLIGCTSFTVGRDADLGDGNIQTNAFTIGINTGLLVAIVLWIYKAVSTGDFSPIPGLGTVN